MKRRYFDILFVRSEYMGSWEGMYINGFLVMQGAFLDPVLVLRRIGESGAFDPLSVLNALYFTVDPHWLNMDEHPDGYPEDWLNMSDSALVASEPIYSYLETPEEQLLMKNTTVVSAFPGVGKTVLFNRSKETSRVVLDSDSSTFPKDKFPGNYIRHIQDSIGKVDVLLVSSHSVVREAMTAAGIEYNLVYPSVDQKEQYLQNYRSRGNTEAFVGLLDTNWESWLAGMKSDKCNNHIELEKGIFLPDVI